MHLRLFSQQLHNRYYYGKKYFFLSRSTFVKWSYCNYLLNIFFNLITSIFSFWLILMFTLISMYDTLLYHFCIRNYVIPFINVPRSRVIHYYQYLNHCFIFLISHWNLIQSNSDLKIWLLLIIITYIFN